MSDVEETANAIIMNMNANCDAGRALLRVAEALADANMQEAYNEDEPTDAQWDRISEAKSLLFLLATHITYGHRWHDSDEVADKRVRFPR